MSWFIWGVMIFYAVMVITSLFMMVDSHENAHRVIFSYYGCNSTIVWDENPFLTTTPARTIPENCPWNDELVLAQSFTDAFGYHFNVYLISMWAAVGILMVMGVHYGERQSEEEN